PEPYNEGLLTGFDESPTQPIGIIILPTTFHDGTTNASRRTVLVKYLVVSCPSIYNCIMGRPTLVSLGAVPSTVHLKMKYHNSENRVITIKASIKRTRAVMKTLWGPNLT
ncbi:hypothetical protein A2U01_0063837, partial [Trifolium medium]|nr:hypothetical protein [Trifolium medium]